MTQIFASPVRKVRRLALVFALGGLIHPAPVGAASPATVSPIDDCQYVSDAAAQAVWRPMRGSAPAQAATLEGRRVLRLPCRFQDTNVERASWDRSLQLDLTSCRGIQFELRCPDASPIAYFSVYFQSGAGWYQAVFHPESSDQWIPITIDKAHVQPEGNPAGWGRLETLRISAWRGGNRDTEFFVRAIRPAGVLGEDVLVAVLRGDTAAQQRPEEARSFEQAAEIVVRHFRAVDIGCVVQSDATVDPDWLNRARLVVLPYNPVLTPETEATLLRYLDQGGKLLAFYFLPERLNTALHLKSIRHVKASPPGQFAMMRFNLDALPGAPREVRQRSWNIYSVEPVAGASRMLAEWHDDAGQPTGYAAVLSSTNGLLMTHILLADDAANQQRLLLAMASALSPEIGRRAAQAAIERIGTIASFKNYDDASRQIGGLIRNQKAAAQALAAADTGRAAALKLTAQNNFAEAAAQAAQARASLLEAYCRVQQPVPDEFRAFWCHSAFGVRGTSWDEAIRRLADQGFNAILPNLLWGGVAFYESQVLPVAPAVAQQGDQLRECLVAARKYGVQVHVWKVNHYLGSAAPREFVDRLRQEGRLQASSRGEEKPWLCPSHPANRQLEVASMLEVARQYDVDGLHFDYIRYPDGDHCYCAGCRERFQQARGVTLSAWPQAVLPGGAQREAWLDWRREHITAIVQAVSEQARALKPRLKISAAVFRNWPVDRDTVGQDWKVWCDRGYLDFVCPMNYTPINSHFENLISQQKQWVGRTPCYPGIGFSAWSPPAGVDRVIEQINLTRQYQTGGFIIFNYAERESRDLLPKLGWGITAKR
ncbi:MAG TPA: family 10 glycosylhydrolase [Verrucomicrobiota bacterium]|nr:MAG: hypothetical protein BWX84_00937 [Verrucomicrobia bacterium ADurb.Bin118]HQB17623.1 family 10 glycosylhydrolase [Verrucomicrobiota bacterium]